MSRQLRFDPPGGWHHVMHRGNRRQTIFATDDDRFDFLDLLAELSDRTDLEIHGFALMGNHYHLMLRCPTGGLSAAMHGLNANYARRFNQRYGLDGHLFQGRFRSLHIADRDYLVEVLRYIHRNPVSARLCRSPIGYEWSSHPAYASGRGPDWLMTARLLEEFGGDTKRLLRFIDAPDTAAARRVADAIDDLQPAIGPPELMAQLLSNVVVGDETRSSAQRIQPRNATSATLAAIAGILDTTPEALITPPRHRQVGLALTALRHGAGCSHDELASLFGYANRSSVASCIQRFEAKVAKQPATQVLYQRAVLAAGAPAIQAA